MRIRPTTLLLLGSPLVLPLVAAYIQWAFMCSEGVLWRCHRRLVADYLLANGVAVRHIMPSGELRPHTLTAGVRVVAGGLTYPPSGGADQEGVAG